MPRNTRTYAPGVGFHVVAVTQGRQHWFVDEVADRIVSDIDEAGAAAGHRILARTVMPNHFHIILRPGSEPLAWMMQRVMQRACMSVKKLHDHEGHVFQARYWAEPVPTPQYLRRAIVYTHDNPCEAEICETPDLYKWSSHNEYLRPASLDLTSSIGFVDGLILFAGERLDYDVAQQNYLEFIRIRKEQRKQRIPGDWLLPEREEFDRLPPTPAGDVFWASTFTHFEGDKSRPRKCRDVQGIAERLLRRIDPAIPFDAIRYAGPKSALSEFRIQLICAMLAAGCAPHQIARLLNLSPSYISKLRRQMRFPVVST